MKNTLLLLLFSLSFIALAHGAPSNPVQCRMFYCTEETPGGCDPMRQSLPIKDYGETSSAFWLNETIDDIEFEIRMYDAKPNFDGEQYVNIRGALYIRKNGKNIATSDIRLFFKAKRRQLFVHYDSVIFSINFNDSEFLISQVLCA